MWNYTQIIDISQPVTSKTAVFPGDTPFNREITVSYEKSQVMNLTAFTMSPHVGTHADAPIHIYGDLTQNQETIGQSNLVPFIGPVVVVDVAPTMAPIQVAQVQTQLERYPVFPKRILFKTQQKIRYEIFEKIYASFSVELIQYLAERDVQLVGIDTPSVDPVDSKKLSSHHALIKGEIAWLENLELTQAIPGEYFLIALPLKFMELEASPVRAVLLQ